jgi:hypothetical protein
MASTAALDIVDLGALRLPGRPVHAFDVFLSRCSNGSLDLVKLTLDTFARPATPGRTGATFRVPGYAPRKPWDGPSS